MTTTAESIDHIQFGIMSTADIRANSIGEITSHKSEAAKTDSSLYDPRMGPMRGNERCPTCNELPIRCDGHFGHIEFAIPVIHPLFTDTVQSLLSCICVSCTALLITEDHLHLWGIAKSSGERRFRRILARVERIKFCAACMTFQPKIEYVSKEDTYYFTPHGVAKTDRQQLHAETIYNMIHRMSDADVRILGFDPVDAHPRNLVMETFPVMPPRGRPYIVANQKSQDDDLTLLLGEIIRENNKIRAAASASHPNEVQRQESYRKMVQSIRAFCDNTNTTKQQKHTNMKPFLGIKDRLATKTGLIRNNIMGKRVNQSARSVIGPDPTLDVDQIAIPPEMADKLSIPVIVNDANLAALQTLVDTRQVNRVLRGIHKYVMAFVRQRFELRPGDVVERKLRDGDFAIVNRQPTLHRGSLIAQRIVIRPGKTIRMNLAITSSLNADFDGDESNIFTPYSEQSRAELAELSSLPNHFVSVQGSKSNITIVQDCLLGTYLLMKNETPLPRAIFQQIFAATRSNGSESEGDGLPGIARLEAVQEKARALNLSPYRGRVLVSALLPPDFCYVDDLVEITRGLVVRGWFTKKHLGGNAQSIVRLLAKEYTTDDCLYFLNNIQFVALAFLSYHGFSVGIRDCLLATEGAQREIDLVVQKSILEAQHMESSTMDEHICEAKINIALGKAKDIGMRIAKNALVTRNRFVDTVESGSKGDYFNIAQIMGLLGQVNVGGKRIQPMVGHGSRTLAHYPLHSGNAGARPEEEQYASRGFIKNSFLSGLSPQEFWMHAQTGREGITDTAMKTSNSGYNQRRMDKLMEDIQVKYDGTVRNSVGSIIQFTYGGDGLDGMHTVVKNGQPLVCDVGRIAMQLNAAMEVDAVVD